MPNLPYELSENNLVFSRPKGRNILARAAEHNRWLTARRESELWPYSTALHHAPEPETWVSGEQDPKRFGINYSSQDYLSLTRHPRVREAAADALQAFGPHSAGSAILQGNTALSLQLERELGETLSYQHILLYPTGWGAGFGAITGLVRQGDVIVMDELAHACLQTGAAAATSHVIRHKHLDIASIPSILEKVRQRNSDAGIMVVTEGLFSMDSDIPDLTTLQEQCRAYDATLLVDIAHDFGAMGPGGTGSLGAQGLLGSIDLVMGSFSKTFASNGGFVATQSQAICDFLKVNSSPHTFSNALSPIQAAVVLACLKIVRSTEGDALRASMLDHARLLRSELSSRGIRCLGDASPIVPALIGEEALGRLASRQLRERNVFANLVEFPGVPVNAARFRLQVMSDHKPTHAVAAADAVADAIEQAEAELNEMRRLGQPV